MTRSQAIDYIYKEKKGSLSELSAAIGEKHLSGLQLTGFIKRGQEESTNTWAITQEAIEFVETITPKKDFTFIEIHHLFNFYFL
jgi:hypothetical protein